VLTCGFMLLTLAAAAGFFRGYIVEQIVGAAGDRLPLWFQTLQQVGHAAVAKTSAAITLGEVATHRDIALLALPMAAGMPQTIVALAALGALAAAVAGAAGQIAALAGIVAEDLLAGGMREPPEDRVRLTSVRLTTAGVGGLAMIGAALVTDPLAAVLVALALSAASAFPVLVMSILWRKVSRTAAIAGMLAGFGVTLVLTFGGLSGLFPMPAVWASAIGGPLNFAILAIISEASPLRSRRALDVVGDMRLPGGEATYDREMRLLRRKRTTAAV
jgi:cation/acetate symporter